LECFLTKNRKKNEEYLKKLHRGQKYDKILVELLWRLNFEDEDRLNCLKDIEKFFKERKPRLTHKIIRKFTQIHHKIVNPNLDIFMLGDKTMKGLVDICGRTTDDCHLICSSGLKLLENLLNPSFTNCSSEFFTIFVNMSSRYLLKLELDKHIKTK
jgi:hypothetical protein